MRKPVGRMVMLLTLVSSLLLGECLSDDDLYVTWPPLEPDKAIAAWLLRQYINTNAVFQFLEKGAAISSGISFDIPGSAYIRDHRMCTSEKVLAVHGIEDPIAHKLGILARKIEITQWYASYTDEEQALVDRLVHLSTMDSALLTNNLSACFTAIEAWSPGESP